MLQEILIRNKLHVISHSDDGNMGWGDNIVAQLPSFCVKMVSPAAPIS